MTTMLRVSSARPPSPVRSTPVPPAPRFELSPPSLFTGEDQPPSGVSTADPQPLRRSISGPELPAGMDADFPKRAGAGGGLPDDPLVEILSRVPVKSLCRFKCVSKAWRGLIDDPLHRRKLPQTLEGFFCGHRRRSHREIRGGGDGDGDGGDGGGGDGVGIDMLAFVYGNFGEGSEDGDGGDGGGGGVFGGIDLIDFVYGHFVDLMGRPAPLVDPSFSFLAEQPGIENIRILHSCNGLLLFRHGRSPYSRDMLGYVVCNPATEEWVAVPSSGWCPDPQEDEDEDDEDREESDHTYLIFDPAVSPHFSLLQFLQKVSIQNEIGLRTYSSETGVWTNRSGDRRALAEEGGSQQLGTFGSIASTLGDAFVNGMLHFIVYHIQRERELIAAVDREGKTRRVINWPRSRGCRWSEPAFVGQSQGRLHCISEHIEGNSAQITIWVLEDYDKEEWVMKHTVSSLQLFGRIKWLVQFDYSVITIHPDRNLVFIVEQGRELICYNMDTREVHAICTLGEAYGCITPYVPYFSESSVLLNKH